MESLLNLQLTDLVDENVRTLLRELADICGVAEPSENGLTVRDALIFALYPTGEGRIAIPRQRVIPFGVLDTKLDKLRDTGVYHLCDELARIEGDRAESHIGSKVYVVLNRFVPEFGVGKKNRRASAAARRRFNIGRGFSG